MNLPPDVSGHLREVFEQMDLLLSCEQVEAGMCCLVSMLQHLRALRRFME